MLDNYDDYQNGGTHKVFTISVVGEDITITNENLRTESIVLDEELCSTSKLKFGSCGTSKFTAEIANVFENFEGKLIEVTVTMDDEVTKYGTFKVVSDKPLADRIFRSLKAYDAMNDIINTNVLDWYNGLTFPITLKNFRDSFFNYLGITQETTSLINDNFSIPGGFTASDSLMGNAIITSICEFNGVFGHINRDGKFTYIDLTAAESFDCPPYENGSVTYEDFVTSPITKVTMRGSASDVGTSVGVDGNEYIIQGNPLIYGTEGKPALTTAMTNLLNKIKTVVFRPFELRKTIGNPCVEIGDAIEIETKYETVNSYVLRRTLTGIQALRDRYSALGSKVYPAEATSYQNEITRAKGKMHEFEVTLDGFSSRVAEVESDVDGLDSDLHTNYSTTNQMNSAIEQSAEGIKTEVSQTYATQQTVTNVKNSTIKSDVLHYLATSAGSGVTRSTPGWTTTIQSMTETNQYLWTYHTYTYGDDHTSDTDPIITGRYGQNGSQGPQGPTGPQGPQGSQGNPGDDGISIVEVIPLKYAGNSTTAPAAPTSNVTRTDAATGVWTRGVPALTNTYKYMYTCDQIKYSNNTYTWTSVVLDNAITNLTQRMTQAELDLQPDSITAKVESTDTFTTIEQFNKLEIGGRNILLNTSAKQENIDKMRMTYATFVTEDDRSVFKLTGNNTLHIFNSTGVWDCMSEKLKANTTYTYSAWIKVSGSGTVNFRFNSFGHFNVSNANSTASDKTHEDIVNARVYKPSTFNKGEWTKISITFTTNALDGSAFGVYPIYNTGASTIVYMYGFKLEEGNRATDWSPAPEDLDANAQGYANAAETTAKSYTDAQLQITSSSILSTVEQGYTTKTEFSNLQIGGENLFPRVKNTNANTEFYTNAAKDIAYDDYTYCMTATGSDMFVYNVASSGDAYATPAGALIPIKAGESVYIKIYDMINSTNVFTKNYVTLYNANKVSLGYSQWYHTEGVYTCPAAQTTAAYMSLRFGYGSAVTGTRYKVRVKIERGNKPTAWSPAPEDIDIVGTNLLRYAPKSKAPTSYQALQLNLTEKLVKGQTYTLQLWDINISNSGKQASELNAAVFAGGGYNLLANITEFTNGHADYKTVTFTVPLNPSQPTHLDNLWLNIYNSPPNSSATMNLTIGSWKLEKGNKATEWQMNPIDASSKSEVQQLANMVAVKVNSSGRLVTAELGVDPASSTSYLKVKADDLDIIANGNLQLTAKTLGIDSTYFKVSSTGVITATSGTIGGFTISETAIQAETGGSTHGLVIQALKTTNYDAIAYAIRVRNSSSDAWTYPFIVRWNGHTTMTNANVTGTITANAGAVGGWKIQSWGLYDDKADTAGNLGAGLTKYGSGPAFWAGCDLNHINTAPFRVLHDGTLCAGNLLATGGTVGGWSIKNYLEQTTSTVLGAKLGYASGNSWMFAVGNPANSYNGAGCRISLTGTVLATRIIATEQSGNYSDQTGKRVLLDESQISIHDSSNTQTLIIYGNGTISTKGSLLVDGSKYRRVQTANYGKKLLNCYETSTPMFGDIGEGKIAEDGKCYVWLDSTFSETIKTDSYQVFLQKYGQGECYVAERTKRYFVVKGDAGLNFAWELKARQAGFENNRLETFNEEFDAFYKTTDYGEKAISHLGLIKDEREVA